MVVETKFSFSIAYWEIGVNYILLRLITRLRDFVTFSPAFV